MLSILIPTYDYNIVPLVEEILSQCTEVNIKFEILAYDDGSKSQLNSNNNQVNSLRNCVFKELPKNVGLSENRNLLIKSSKYDHIILLDADSVIYDEQFITRYLEAFEQNPDIIYGGLSHPNKVQKTQILRWKYGKQREEIPVEVRIHKPYKYMRSNNTAFHRRIFEFMNFDNTLTKYGHEDSLFAYNASMNKLKVMHIHNPVIHGDIDNNSTFLNKTKSSIENLNYIHKKQLIDKNFIPFIYYFDLIKKFGLNYILFYFFKLFNPIFKWHLKSSNPSLKIFDLYRLSYFCYINLKQ